MKRRMALMMIATMMLAALPTLADNAIPKFDDVDGLIEPEIVEKVNPKYPEEARKEKVSGVVVLEAVIDKDGYVGEIKILEDPDFRLSKAAADAVAQWKFKPARTEEGKAVAVWYNLTVKFNLR